jgi:hypothetical protein
MTGQSERPVAGRHRQPFGIRSGYRVAFWLPSVLESRGGQDADASCEIPLRNGYLFRATTGYTLGMLP